MTNTFSSTFLRELALDIEEVDYAMISELEDPEPSLYFIKSGRVELYLPRSLEHWGSKGESVLATLKEGC